MEDRGVSQRTWRLEDGRVRVSLMPGGHGDAFVIRVSLCDANGVELVSWDRVTLVGDFVEVGPLGVDVPYQLSPVYDVTPKAQAALQRKVNP